MLKVKTFPMHSRI